MDAKIYQGDCRDTLKRLAAEGARVNTCVTSPPYFGLRDYGCDGQIGLEETPDAYVAKMVEVFRCVRDVLADDGTVWLNLGDSYAGSWGAQGRTGQMADRSVISARQIAAHPHKKTRTGSIKQDGLKQKDLIGIPWRVALALQADGWWLRQDIIWSKPNPMPDSTTDRCTRSHEYIFMLTKSARYYYDHEAIREPAVSSHPSGNGFVRDARLSYLNADGTARGNAEQWKPQVADDRKDLASDTYSRHRSRIEGGQSLQAAPNGWRNRRSVWTVSTKPYKGAHFATFPTDLIEPCILAGAPKGGLVLDPFNGSGTTGYVALKHGRRYIGCELNPDYVALSVERIGHGLVDVRSGMTLADLPPPANDQIGLFDTA